MTAKNKIDPEEAFAFLNVVAPKLEQLRRRLAAADKTLKAGDPDTARLNAITESQLAVREFLSSIPHLSSLVDPIDALLEAVREEPEELPPPPAALVPDPAPPSAPQVEPAPTMPIPETPRMRGGDRWLQIGTVLAVHRLVTAGMPDAAAELHVRDAFDAVNLRQGDTSPITDDTIKEWRSQFTGGRNKAWRGRPTLRRKAGGSFAALTEAKKRVAEMAAMFKQMLDLGAAN